MAKAKAEKKAASPMKPKGSAIQGVAQKAESDRPMNKRLAKLSEGGVPKEKKPRAPKEAPAPFQHDPRVPSVGTVIERKLADGKLVSSIKVLHDGFEGVFPKKGADGEAFAGCFFKSASAAAKAASGKSWFGLVYYGVIPYNARERRGINEKDLVDAYDDAQGAFNAVAASAGFPGIPGSLKDALDSDPKAARQAAAEIHKTAKKVAGWAKALESSANLIEVRHGRAA